MDDENEWEPSNYFSFGGQDREFIEIRVLSRASEEDYWDGNWMVCEVVLSAGGFRGGFQANIRTNEIAAFAAQVKTLYEALKGTAILDTMEGQIQLTLQGDGRGHISCEGSVKDEAGTGNLLRFRLGSDQTLLFGTLTQLERVVSRFPVRGSPAA